MKILVVLFILIPALEISLFVLFSHLVGVWLTIACIAMTGIGGVWLAKRQGLTLLQEARWELMHGRLPNGALLDGICVLAGGFLLLVPGFLTDVIGSLLLFPATRRMAKPIIARWLKTLIETKTFFYVRR
ncbi:fxsA cytoplasmic membrane family protein [Anoxybacillus sp. B7M1]|jgi:UPF0716 protein FxsA|uniref:Membrane protein FxsA n=1 Tax=Anoxybacteroides rupiense TaxID=311460 RepID=A0ABD5IT37_9BACL|nr:MULTISPECIES: FxsA family protein [Anoxybacillus]ANB56234.1 fxsA cytoplasmic membrane family protein [Anoxybacillus sp. B2M1]ANB65612.1 fxsA cytoplasmic membrane family protein [Anoxybacillus sp. B7M1]KXG11592.1 hypothetical protein AT864_00676 [Anoxybacillus sp. P3H1B]MBS2771966.1 membrane protein FxsA [Anoxybacillus rupiensis]MDE8562925.1 membrane protein FxsA [Anoxybacillus rupiensis]